MAYPSKKSLFSQNIPKKVSQFMTRRCNYLVRRGGGLVVSVPASRSPVPGSNLGNSFASVQ